MNNLNLNRSCCYHYLDIFYDRVYRTHNLLWNILTTQFTHQKELAFTHYYRYLKYDLSRDVGGKVLFQISNIYQRLNIFFIRYSAFYLPPFPTSPQNKENLYTKTLSCWLKSFQFHQN